MCRLCCLTFDPECSFSASEEVAETGASRNTTDCTIQEAVTYDSEMGTMTSQQPSLCDHVVAEEEGKPLRCIRSLLLLFKVLRFKRFMCHLLFRESTLHVIL